MNRFIDWHFCVQKGMYFDVKEHTQGCHYYFSNIIEDSYWNYALLDEGGGYNRVSLKDLESVFEAKNRVPCFYIIDRNNQLTELSHLSDYSVLFEESFMVYRDSGIQKKRKERFLVKRVSSEEDTAVFMNVFISAYGGEKTPEQPYGELDDTYYNALLRSFSDRDKFYHYICYDGDQAVSIASLCFQNQKGGIYNVGTVPQFRGKGFGSIVTNECICQWKKMDGEVLFLQTEAGSAVEKLYHKLGFESIFHGRGLVKEK